LTKTYDGIPRTTHHNVCDKIYIMLETSLKVDQAREAGSAADPDPTDAFLTLGSGIGKKIRILDPRFEINIPDHISQSLVIIFD
jgi:hypothetical protein